MIAMTTAVQDIPALEHDEAMRLAGTEYQRLLAVVDAFRGDEWSQQTDCPDWDVRDMLGHLLGAFEALSDPQERMRQVQMASEVAARTGCLRLDAMTALQVSAHAHLTTDEVRLALHQAVPRALAARRATTPEHRAATYSPALPGERDWSVGYLFDVIHTRDPWIHRIDITRATGHEMVLSPVHDGRIVADVVAEWARRHGEAFTMTLTGPAGHRFTAGAGGAELELDALEFCRTLSGRTQGEGLLATRVPF